MAREVGAGSPINYLKINRDGFLYLSSKEPKEGYKKVELRDEKVAYHKLFHGTDEGYLDFISIKEAEFQSGKVKYLTLSVNAGEYIDNISMPLFKTNGALNDYVKNLATLLPNLDFSRKISINPSKRKNDAGFVDNAFFINYDEKEFVKFFHKYGKDGDVPPAEKVEGVSGDKYDFTKQDKFLYNSLLEQIERFKAFKSGNTTPKDAPSNVEQKSVTNTPKEVPQASAQIVGGAPEEEEDDLPF